MNQRLTARSAHHGARMVHGFLRTVVKLAVASLIVETIVAHYGITSDVLMQRAGLSQDQLIELARRGVDWALPNLVVGALVIVPVWFVIYFFRPPRSRSD